ncbi:hypothetical protein [Cryptosporangium minutisporangium]|uniref:hypothetical protein n=1 Tax=Cryptosporangium minutisporangium TaxID=113569 RepID=UPI0031EA576C
MGPSQSNVEVPNASAAERSAAEADATRPDTDPVDAGQALRLAVSQQAELLALLTRSVRSDFGALDETSPSGTVDLIGALGPLEDPGVPGNDPLHAFAVVVPRFAQDAEQVITDLGGRGQAA